MDDIASNTQISQHPVEASDLLALRPGADEAFDRFARRVFESQIQSSPTYKTFAEQADIPEKAWGGWRSVPFLPVRAFKWPGIVGFPAEQAEAVFLSSATGGRRSRHPVLSAGLYDALAIASFQDSVGVGPFWFVAHLPTYETLAAESSLLHMVKALIDQLGTQDSLLVPDSADLRSHVTRRENGSTFDSSMILFGTAFGLLEMVEVRPLYLPPGSLIIETGGMKLRRREIDRTTLHNQLAVGFGVPRESIRSEYGMCEMLSQHYTRGGQVFHSPPWVRTMVVDPENQNREMARGRAGQLAVFDLANCHSVSPILTEDLVLQRDDGFEVLGRLAHAELRGCNFLFEQEG